MNQVDFLKLQEQVFSCNSLSEYITPESSERFFELSHIMLEANATMNLTALRDEKAVITKHFADCLLAAKYLPQKPCRLLDVGSGGGMPALPFAIVRPDIEITALDATAKKTAYISRAAKALGLRNVDTLTGRAEELGTDLHYREKFDVVCARAVAELPILLEWCIPFVKNGGIFIALKGKNGPFELKKSENAFHELFCELESKANFCLEDPLAEEPETSERYIYVIRKKSPTLKKYPRRNALITKSPL